MKKILKEKTDNVKIWKKIISAETSSELEDISNNLPKEIQLLPSNKLEIFKKYNDLKKEEEIYNLMGMFQGAKKLQFLSRCNF